MSAPHNLLDGAVLSLGSAAVLRPFFERLDTGRAVTLLALGSSITTNRGGGGAAYDYVGVDYLTSFERMGRARLRCAEVPGGCTCAPRTLDAHTREHASVRRVAYLKLGGAGLANCVVELTTLDRSSSGGFKWKLVRLSVGLALE